MPVIGFTWAFRVTPSPHRPPLIAPSALRDTGLGGGYHYNREKFIPNPIDSLSERGKLSEKPKELDIEKIEYALRGKTLQVYMYLLRNKRGVGVREVQRALRFSSPSLAFHHLDKLESLGLVGKDTYGRYIVRRKVDVGVLSLFVNVMGLALPRYLFYASFFTTIMAYQILTSYIKNPMALIVAAVAAFIFWYETFRIWRRRPF
jgi:predicted DNA-binding transcriptional regulator